MRPEWLGPVCKSVGACQEGSCSKNSSLMTRHEVANGVITPNCHQMETQPGVGGHGLAQLLGHTGVSAVWMAPLEVGSLHPAHHNIQPGMYYASY